MKLFSKKNISHAVADCCQSDDKQTDAMNTEAHTCACNHDEQQHNTISEVK